jgi:hypothetical protein
MKNMQIYEQKACVKGECSPEIERELARIDHMVQDLRERGGCVQRYNIIDEGATFLESELVKKTLEKDGIESLPIIIVEGVIESQGEYPTDLELAKWAGLPWSDLAIYAEREKRGIMGLTLSDESMCGNCN